jgi:hypothetical protein
MYVRKKTKKSIQFRRLHRAADPFIVPLHDRVVKDRILKDLAAADFQWPL